MSNPTASKVDIFDAAERLRRNLQQQGMESGKLLLAVAPSCWADHTVGFAVRPTRIFVTPFEMKHYRVPTSVCGYPVEVYDPPRGELPTDKPEDLVFDDEAKRA